MATTKYQVLYRLMNTSMDIPITNSDTYTYEPTFVFYTDPDHRIFSSDNNVMYEEIDKQQQMITYAHQATNPKHDMLFVYDGTKKLSHPKYQGEELGYVVRNWYGIRSKIGVNGDYTKDFVTIGAATPEDGGIVVCKASKINKYFDLKKRWTLPNGKYTSAEVMDLINQSTIFKIKEERTLDDFATKGIASQVGYCTERALRTVPSHESCHWGVVGYMLEYGTATSYFTVYTGNIYIDGVKDKDYVASKTGYQVTGSPWTSSRDGLQFYPVNSYSTELHNICVNKDIIYSNVSYSIDDIETAQIPGHYEDSGDSPYCIKDVYKRIEASPWIVNTTLGSLAAALEKAKLLVDAIGLENVRVVKLVALDQDIKIK